MPSETQLLLDLSRIRNKRLGVETKLYKEMFYEAYNDELVAIIKDNWNTDEETGERYFDTGKSQQMYD